MGSAPQISERSKAYHRQQYFEALKLAEGGLDASFQKQNINKEIQNKIPELPSDLYKDDASVEKLTIQLKSSRHFYRRCREENRGEDICTIYRLMAMDKVTVAPLRSRQTFENLSDYFSDYRHCVELKRICAVP